MSTTRASGSKLRVFSIPGRGQTNPFFDLFFDALEPLGAVPVPMTAAGLIAQRFDVLHLHFPTHFITQNGRLRAFASAVVLSAAFAMTRLSGRPIVLTVHDVVPLEPRHEWLLWPYYAFVRACIDGYAFLSDSSREAFIARFPRESKKPWRFAPHGPYRVDVLDDAERAARRDSIAGADALVVGVLGKVKAYKGVAALAHVPERLSNGRRVHLLVAGAADAAEERAVARALATRSRSSFTRLPDALSDRALDVLIQSVDAVALPYEAGSNSGAALLVLSNHGRLIGSTLAIFRELAADPGPPWAQVCDDTPQSWRSALDAIAGRPVTDTDRKRLETYLADHSFAASAEAAMSLYTALRTGRE